MEALLRESEGIEVVLATGQEDVARVSDDVWRTVDVAIVELFDETAPGQKGTDMYSGISAIQHLARLNVQTVALVPHGSHPLVQLRIAQSGANYAYLRHEVQTLDQLEQVILHPSPGRKPEPPSKNELDKYGARRARPNESVSAYQRSRIHGKVSTESEVDDLHIHRNTLAVFRKSIMRTGFTGTEQRSGRSSAPRWPDVRSYLLRILGREPKV